jgi:hypothetical protein
MKKTIVTFSCLIAFVAIFSLAQAARGAESATESAKIAFLEAVNNYPSDTSLFTPGKTLTVHTRSGDIPIAMFRLTNCNPTTLGNVEAHLTKYQADTDVEIPRIFEIYYDNCTETIAAGDKGDIYIPNTAGGPVLITFKLLNLKKTKWKQNAKDSVFVGKPSTSAIAPPVAPGALPCGGTVARINDYTISFPMSASCTNSSKDTYYAYALHMDQKGSDGVTVDIGIDPQIINHAPGRGHPKP